MLRNVFSKIEWIKLIEMWYEMNIDNFQFDFLEFLFNDNTDRNRINDVTTTNAEPHTSVEQMGMEMFSYVLNRWIGVCI